MVDVRLSLGARRLAALLERCGLTQLEIEAQVGASPGSVSRWLTGERRPGLDIAVAIEREYGIPVRAWTQEADAA